MLDRRGFLKLFGMGAAAATVAPTYFFAPANGWTATESGLSIPNAGNEFLNVEWVSAKTLEILKSNLALNWDDYERLVTCI